MPSPTEYGWKDDSKHWMCSLPAPEVVFELLTCKCVRSFKLLRCLCLANGLPCTLMCRIQTCSNPKLQNDPEPDFHLDSQITRSSLMSKKSVMILLFWKGFLMKFLFSFNLCLLFRICFNQIHMLRFIMISVKQRNM